ncbi:MAG: LytTR family DNA-binding domain-containing protein [Ginsengibacter sp.]
MNKINNTIVSENKQESSIVEAEGFVYFRAERKMIKVKYADVVYVESMKDYIKIVRVNEKPLLVKQSISSIEEILPANLFLRVHRSFIVAIDKINAFTNHDVEIGGKEIPIGRLYAHQMNKMAKN